MPSYRTGSVTEILAERVGLQRVVVEFDSGERARAYNLTALTGPVAIGDPVVCNTTAVELGLGTGGWHVVHWNLANRELRVPGGGHIMKLRYTSLQADTGAAEDRGAELPATLDGLPVVVCSLHSQMAVAAAAFGAVRSRLGRPARLAYVMTDGAALPIALSDLVVQLRDRDLLCGTVTAGHAFGGDLEAVNVLSAIAVAAGHLRADAVVVAMGPGVVGTGSALGTTALEVAAIAEGATRLGASVAVAARGSSGDPRERHRGISHHTRTALQLCGRVTIPIPTPGLATPGVAALEALGHTVAPVKLDDIAQTLDRYSLRVTTMGRDVAADRLFFDLAAAAGTWAAHRLDL